MLIKEIAGFQVEVTRKKTKNMRLRIRADGVVAVSAPYLTPDFAVNAFVQSQKDWIIDHQARRANRPATRVLEYVTGEKLPVWGEEYLLKVSEGPKFSLILLSGKAHLQRPAGSAQEKCDDYLREWYRKELKKSMAQRTPHWEQITGLHASSWTTRDMSTRWGSCNTKTGHITLNVQLAKYPPVCLDYVILHELAHLEEHGHGAEFKAILDQYMPDWRDVRKILRG